MTLRRTPLYTAHQKAGGKLIEFGGWEMPVQYSSIVDEHLAVRRAAGLFDISHMGEVEVRGPQAETFLNQLLTNDVRKLAVGQGQYTLMCNERGGAVDDLYVYRLGAEEFFLIVNASRVTEDFAWMQKAAASSKVNVELHDRSEIYGAVALQGPKSRAFIDACFPVTATGGSAVTRPSQLVKNSIGIFESAEAGRLLIASTGYSGEDGFEIVAAADKIEAVWNQILAVGHAHCCQPAGLGARDTLRTEMCYPLYGHELDENTTPIEAGLGFFVSFEKGDFIGRAPLLDQKTQGPSRRCVAFRMGEKTAPPRPQYPILDPNAGSQSVGVVVSGTQSPSLNCGIGMGYVPAAIATPGTAIEIEVRGRKWPATVVKKPIWRRS